MAAEASDSGAPMSPEIKAKGDTTFPRLLPAREQTARPASHPGKYLGIWQTKTWRQFDEQSREVAGGLANLGVKRGDNIAIIGDNRPNLYAAMMGVQMLGAVPTAVPRRRCQ